MKHPVGRGFASDNCSGAHPKVVEFIEKASRGYEPAYGADSWTARAEAAFRELFGERSESFLVFNGTAANVLGISSLLKPWESVLCSEDAHLNIDECGGLERFAGVKIIGVKTTDGKLSPELLTPVAEGHGDQHRVQPKVISLSQSTEHGTLYSREEVAALAEFAHARGMYLHMDGARLGNACASLGLTPMECVREPGVDVLSFGGTKNGLLCGEAVIFFDPLLADGFKFVRKQGLQLASKMRFLAAQFVALLEDDLWLDLATHANAMARRLEERVAHLPGLELTRRADANALFARLPPAAIADLQQRYHFYMWDEPRSEVRWMTSFDTTEADVDDFAAAVRAALAAAGAGAT